jgi:hypothetical protein
VARTIPNVYVGPTHTYTTQPSKFGLFLRLSYLSQGHVVLKFSGVPKASRETCPKCLANTDSLIGYDSFGTSGSLNILLK